MMQPARILLGSYIPSACSRLVSVLDLIALTLLLACLVNVLVVWL